MGLWISLQRVPLGSDVIRLNNKMNGQSRVILRVSRHAVGPCVRTQPHTKPRSGVRKQPHNPWMGYPQFSRHETLAQGRHRVALAVTEREGLYRPFRLLALPRTLSLPSAGSSLTRIHPGSRPLIVCVCGQSPKRPKLGLS